MKLRKMLTVVAFGLVPISAHATDGFFVITNKADGNSVASFAKGDDGKFSMVGEYPTGGKGTGDLEIPALQKDETHPLANGDDPLIAAESLAATPDGNYLIAVNPGDATVSLMAITNETELASVSVVPATDLFPVSAAVSGNMVIVASVGKDNGSGSLGFYHLDGGKLVVPDNNRRDLMSRPSTVGFSPDGKFAIVNGLVTGKIMTFATEGGVLSEAPVSTIDSPRSPDERFHAIPVGFKVRDDEDGATILMSEARFLTNDYMLRAGNGEVVQSPLYTWQTGSLSTYHLTDDGQLSLVDGDVLTGDAIEGGEIANCWVEITGDGKTLWAVNALSSSLSSFHIAEDGSAAISNLTAFKDDSEEQFLSDLALSVDESQMYQLVGNRGEVIIFDVAENGDLTEADRVGGLPALGSYGMVAH